MNTQAAAEPGGECNPGATKNPQRLKRAQRQSRREGRLRAPCRAPDRMNAEGATLLNTRTPGPCDPGVHYWLRQQL